MRVVAAALVCLLAGLVVGCDYDEAVRAAGPSSPAEPIPPPAPHPTSIRLPEHSRPPAVAVTTESTPVETQAGSYCWQANGAGVCADAVGPDPATLPVLASTGRQAGFEFPVEGWRFRAYFTPVHGDELGDRPAGLYRKVKEQSPGRYVFTAPDAGTDYQVQLFGRGPQGDYSAYFRWTIRR